MSAGKRIEKFSDRLHAISQLAAEQGSSLDRQTDPAQHRSVAAPGLTRWQVFFRFSTRQCMFLIITLSMCFAVNRNNHIDDLIFLFSMIFNPIFILYLIVLALIAGKCALSGPLSPLAERTARFLRRRAEK
jgi:hypothetical protein